MAAALEARALGTDISIETCPHYLLFTEDDLLRIGALAKCTPPLRSAADRDALVDCVLDGSVDMIASDHSPCPPNMKEREDFFGIWGGIAGVQFTRVGLAEIGISADRIAALTATNGATRFGIADKGSIEPGKHADLTLMNFNAPQTVSEDALFQRHRGTPYAGMKFASTVTHAIRRGEIIYSNGTIVARSNGKFVGPGRG